MLGLLRRPKKQQQPAPEPEQEEQQEEQQDAAQPEEKPKEETPKQEETPKEHEEKSEKSEKSKSVSKKSEKSRSAQNPVEEEKVPEPVVEELPQSRYSYVDRELAKWVDDTLGCEAIARLGEKPHPVELIYELTAHWVPELRNMPNLWKTPRNRMKSKLRKVREFFIAWGVESPLHWCSFVDFDENDKRHVLNYNLSLAAMKNHFLVEQRNALIKEQHQQLTLCRNLQNECNESREKLGKIHEIVKKNPKLPFASLIEEIVTKEPSCFKPLDL